MEKNMKALDQVQVYCSDQSRLASEPLLGTAIQTQTFLLLEYSGTWGEKVPEQSDLPEPVKARLDDLGKSIPGLKTLLIRTQRSQRSEAGVRLFIATVAAHPPRLYAFQLPDYSDLLHLDIPAVVAGEPAYDVHHWDLPLYLVCAHGRRDVCCARHGLPVYNALSAATQSRAEPLVWQSSHVGGHRFAANLLCLPHGLLYGRVNPGVALAIVEADHQERVYLPNLRGRVCYSAVAQAAEVYLRGQHAEDRLEAYILVAEQEIAPGEWVVRFREHSKDKGWAVTVRPIQTEKRTLESCSKEKTTPIIDFVFELEEAHDIA
jgi:hypothetical protein